MESPGNSALESGVALRPDSWEGRVHGHPRHQPSALPDACSREEEQSSKMLTVRTVCGSWPNHAFPGICDLSPKCCSPKGSAPDSPLQAASLTCPSPPEQGRIYTSDVLYLLIVLLSLKRPQLDDAP